MKKIIKKFLKTIIPSRSLNLRSAKNYRKLVGILAKEFSSPQVLVVGGRILGAGINEIIDNPNIKVIETDIQMGPRTQSLCDAHALPFKNGSFDAVIVQAVLEHVFDPVQCVREISRVLAENGYVYAETPFMQQVHDAPYDFQRFTYFGHRLLFRQFNEIESGPVAGPGTVLFWAYISFLSSFSDQKYSKAILLRIALISGFWFKYFDYLLISKQGTLSGASALYFLGRKRRSAYSNRELIEIINNRL